MISIVIGAILAGLFAGLLVLRVRCGELRVSELPVLLLALLAGSEEKGRLRLILSHREAVRPAPRETEKEATARWERDKEDAGAFGTLNTLRRERKEAARCYCNWCHGRAGVHGAEAKALYQAEVSAAMRGVTMAEFAQGMTALAKAMSTRRADADCEACAYWSATERRLCRACDKRQRNRP